MDLQLFINAPVATTIFIITIITSIRAFQEEHLRDKLMLNPYDVVHHKEYYRLLSSGLVHGSHMHIILNMLSFYFFAFYLESNDFIGIQSIGHAQFAILYVLSLIFSNAATIYKHKNDPGYNSLGASGAISAVVVSMVMMNPNLPLGIIFIPGISVPGWLLALAFIGYSYFASRNNRMDNINHDAHLWGALSGIVLTPILAPQTPQIITIVGSWLSGIT